MNKYEPHKIEPKWQKIWADAHLYSTDDDSSKPKSYILDYFPYPSGAGLSVGHVRNYTISDVYPRFRRMMGDNVLHPMGWDGFGLPAENYAIKQKISPRQATDENKANYKKQMQGMGFSYDWSREVDSTDPKYYKWTQWFFLLLFERGLAYQKESEQWWCPNDKTVLANEQVIDGKCWRCGHEVTKKTLKQWFFKITDYADRLIDDLNGLDWPEGIKAQQKNWIGRSFGVKLKFDVKGRDEIIETFTTRVDTLGGATFIVLAPEHPLVEKLTTEKQVREVKKYVEKAKTESEIDRMDTDKPKTGVFTGSYAINPLNNDEIPIWVADYVLMGYGTGAIMAVPAHDQRDFDFAKKFDLPIKHVVDPVLVRDDAKDMTQFKKKRKIVALVENDEGEILTINWGPKLGGRLTIGGTIEGSESPVDTALREIEEETGYHDLEVDEVGAETVHYKYYAFSKQQACEAAVNFVRLKLKSNIQKAQKLDDYEHGNFKVEWVNRETAEREITEPLHRYGYDKFIHGQVYTGEGPLVHSGKYADLAGDEAKHAITEDLHKEGRAEATTNYRLRDWLISRQRYWGAPMPIIHCEKDGAVAVPEDQLPVMLPEIKSYEPAGDGKSPLARVESFVKTTCPKCGGPAERETDTMDGFACSSWYFLRFADPHNDKKAFDIEKVRYWLPVDTYIGGAEHAVLHLLYARFWTKVMKDANIIDFDEPFLTLRNQGMILASDGRKMSKSSGNVITPEAVIDQGYGADALRLFEMFIAPYNEETNWQENGLAGTDRFIRRVWRLVEEFTESTEFQPNAELETALASLTNKTIKKVTSDISSFAFNTAVAALMEFVNGMYKLKPDLPLGGESWREAINALLKLLAPFAPFVTEELWKALGEKESIHLQGWPKYHEKLIKEDLVEIPIQVNGKLRATITITLDSTEAETTELAKKEISRQLEGQEIVRTVVVPRKLINFVTK